MKSRSPELITVLTAARPPGASEFLFRALLHWCTGLRMCNARLGLLLLVSGCAGARVGLATHEPGAEHRGAAAPAASWRDDPMPPLREAERRAARLTHYSTTLYRQERIGLIPSLRAPELLRAYFRAQPFSVKFNWLDPNSEYREALYVEGRNDNKVLLLPRSGLLGFTPVVARYHPMDAVTFGKARNPITDFGVHRMMQRTLKRIDSARALGGAAIRYLGRCDVEGTLADRFELRYPTADPWPNKRQDLYLDAATGLPLGTSLWLPRGGLDAAYLYLNLHVDEPPPSETLFTISHSRGDGRTTPL